MKKYITILILSISFYGCNKKSEVIKEHSYIPDHEIIFETGSPISNIYGVYFHKPDSTEYMYFAMPITYKRIKFFTFDGDLKWDIPLNEMVRNELNIQMISVQSIDTIIGLSYNTNNLYYMNSAGVCWKVIDPNAMIDSLQIHAVEISESHIGDFLLNDSTYIFATNCGYDSTNITDDMTQLEKFKIFWGNISTFYKLIRMDIKKDEITLTPGLNHFYSNTPEVRFSFYPSRYTTENNEILFLSFFGDEIFKINPHSLTIESKHKIESDFTKIGYEAPIVNDETIPVWIDLLNKYPKTRGRLHSIHYDQYADQYIVQVIHTVDENLPDSLISKNKSCSLVILDSAFQKIDEIYFAPLTFSTTIHTCKEGMLMSTNFLHRPDYIKTKSRFMLYKRNEKYEKL